jgi:hypothetical protein
MSHRNYHKQFSLLSTALQIAYLTVIHLIAVQQKSIHMIGGKTLSKPRFTDQDYFLYSLDFILYL